MLFNFEFEIWYRILSHLNEPISSTNMLDISTISKNTHQAWKKHELKQLIKSQSIKISSMIYEFADSAFKMASTDFSTFEKLKKETPKTLFTRDTSLLTWCKSQNLTSYPENMYDRKAWIHWLSTLDWNRELYSSIRHWKRPILKPKYGYELLSITNGLKINRYHQGQMEESFRFVKLRKTTEFIISKCENNKEILYKIFVENFCHVRGKALTKDILEIQFQQSWYEIMPKSLDSYEMNLLNCGHLKKEGNKWWRKNRRLPFNWIPLNEKQILEIPVIEDLFDTMFNPKTHQIALKLWDNIKNELTI